MVIGFSYRSAVGSYSCSRAASGYLTVRVGDEKQFCLLLFFVLDCRQAYLDKMCMETSQVKSPFRKKNIHTKKITCFLGSVSLYISIFYLFYFIFSVFNSKTSTNRPGRNSLLAQNHDSEKTEVESGMRGWRNNGGVEKGEVEPKWDFPITVRSLITPSNN